VYDLTTLTNGLRVLTVPMPSPVGQHRLSECRSRYEGEAMGGASIFIEQCCSRALPPPHALQLAEPSRARRVLTPTYRPGDDALLGKVAHRICPRPWMC